MPDLASESLTLAPTADPRVFRSAEGKLLSPPAGWECLPPGDAGLTRRVKAAGPTWTVVEKKGRKTFSRGVWAPAANIAAARAGLDQERATPAYAKKRAQDVARRERAEQRYSGEFELEVLRFLRFSPRYEALARKLARAVTAHATVVGSGTVARTQRITVDRRAEAAVIAWMRHQTTDYDDLSIPRVKGMRREVRRDLAEVSRSLLALHRTDGAHSARDCPLCQAVEKLPAPAAPAS